VSVSHVAIIMDGNGRWAEQRGLPRLAGHSRGVEVAREIAVAARDMGIGYLTLFAFSTENWKRPAEEVSGIFSLLRQFFAREASDLARSGIRIRTIGDIEGLPEPVRRVIEDAERMSSGAQRLVVNIAMNYGGRWDVVSAARKLAEAALAGDLDPSLIDENRFAAALSTAGQPDPDLVIRTGGDMRISNFLLWQTAYSELYVSPVLWPDFTPVHFKAALDDFASRDRRFGGIRKRSDEQRSGEGVDGP
jgi:undecaprenyl diphosphate synthase